MILCEICMINTFVMSLIKHMKEENPTFYLNSSKKKTSIWGFSLAGDFTLYPLQAFSYFYILCRHFLITKSSKKKQERSIWRFSLSGDFSLYPLWTLLLSANCKLVPCALKLRLRADYLKRWLELSKYPGGGGVLTLTWYTYMCLPFGALFREIWYSDRGVFISDEGAKITQIRCSLANSYEKHPVCSKLGAFLSKMVYWWVWNRAKNWYRESQIFEVRQAQPRTILVKVTPPGLNTGLLYSCWTQTMDNHNSPLWQP